MPMYLTKVHFFDLSLFNQLTLIHITHIDHVNYGARLPYHIYSSGITGPGSHSFLSSGITGPGSHSFLFLGNYGARLPYHIYICHNAIRVIIRHIILNTCPQVQFITHKSILITQTHPIRTPSPQVFISVKGHPFKCQSVQTIDIRLHYECTRCWRKTQGCVWFGF